MTLLGKYAIVCGNVVNLIILCFKLLFFVYCRRFSRLGGGRVRDNVRRRGK